MVPPNSQADLCKTIKGIMNFFLGSWPSIHLIDGNFYQLDVVKRIKRLTMVVLPAPVGPTMATFWVLA